MPPFTFCQPKPSQYAFGGDVFAPALLSGLIQLVRLRHPSGSVVTIAFTIGSDVCGHD
jgi:hypothetical protein